MIDYEELEIEGMQHGFTHVAPLDCKTVELMPEVRAMCEQNTCHRYGKCWSCPPGCGSLEECQKIIDSISMELLYRQWENWRMNWTERP